MEQFAYSFAITMMHSVWQMALLLLFYYVLTAVFRKWPPLAKRNLLLVILSAQLLSSAISFYFVYSKPFLDYRENLQSVLQNLSASQSWLQQYAPLLLALYVFGLLYKLSFAWFNWRRFNVFYKNSLVKPSVDIRLFTEAKAIHFGIKRKVQVWCSRHVQSPVTFGFFKPVILLPVALVNKLNLQQTESLIVHELTHIKNNDYLFNWLMLVADAVFFFNPFVKIAIQKVKTEREKSCDIQVLQFNYPAIGYAEALLHIAQQQQAKVTSAPIAAVNKKTELLNRIRFFSNDKNISSQQTKYFSFAAFFIWSFILLNVFFAGVLVTVTKPQASKEISGLFVTSPLNEWNKSFSTEAVEPSVALNDIEEAIPTATIETNDEPIDTEKSLTANESAVAAVSEDAPALEEPAYKPSLVSNKEALITVKDVIIDEEVSGATVSQAYRITTTATGEVTIEPLWVITEVKKLSDSMKLAIKKDSSIINVVPVVQ